MIPGFEIESNRRFGIPRELRVLQLNRSVDVQPPAERHYHWMPDPNGELAHDVARPSGWCSAVRRVVSGERAKSVCRRRTVELDRRQANSPPMFTSLNILTLSSPNDVNREIRTFADDMNTCSLLIDVNEHRPCGMLFLQTRSDRADRSPPVSETQ
jgi:hypothetical protein